MSLRIPTGQPHGRTRKRTKGHWEPSQDDLDLIASCTPPIYVGQARHHYCNLAPHHTAGHGLPPACYRWIELQLAKGNTLDTALRQVGMPEGIKDPRWLAWKQMFPQHYRALEAVAACKEGQIHEELRKGKLGWASLGWHLERTRVEVYGTKGRSAKSDQRRGSAIEAAVDQGRRGGK